MACPAPVTGLLYGGGTQILAQLAEFGVNRHHRRRVILVFFTIIKRRACCASSAADELSGLDIPEMGGEGYPKDREPAPDGHSRPAWRCRLAGWPRLPGD